MLITKCLGVDDVYVRSDLYAGKYKPDKAAYKRLVSNILRKFNWWHHCLALCHEIFGHFPLFD